MEPEAPPVEELEEDEPTRINLKLASPADDEPTELKLTAKIAADRVAGAHEAAWSRLEKLFATLVDAAADDEKAGRARALVGDFERFILRQAAGSEEVEPVPTDTEVRPVPGGLPPGHLLANTFIVRTRLAMGGMGEIYRVRHRDLKTDYAMKLLRSEYRNDDKLAELFEEEARLMLRIRHDAVVGCYAMLRGSDGRQMLLLDLVEGPSLSQRLRRAPLGASDVPPLIERLGGGLKALHAAGIVHQDLSPDNILLPDDDLRLAKIIDFGVARSLRRPRAVPVDFAGKYSFAAPEQLGLYGGEVGLAADLYTFGLTLAAAVRGEKLAMGQTEEEAVAKRRAIPPLHGVPDSLRPLLIGMLEPDPRRRIATIDAVLVEAAALAPSIAGAKPVNRRRFPWLAWRRA